MLFGRDAELEMLAAFAAGTAEFDSSVFLIAGDPGIGKTALLDAAVEIAERAGRAVLGITALEYEAELTFGALNQLLLPLLDDLPTVNEVHRQAIAVICGLELGAPPSQLIAGAATLALVRTCRSAPAAALRHRRRALVGRRQRDGVDLPGSSAQGCRRAAARRCPVGTGERLRAKRIRGTHPPATIGPERRRSAQGAFPALAVNVRMRIRAEARGNPLALLDLPAALDNGRALPEVLPLTDRLRSLYAQRLRDLPEGTREMLLFVVLAGAENSMTLENCIPTPQARVNLPPAERAGIVGLSPRSGRMEFRHPLIRAAVFELSTSDERHRAHALLAEAFDTDPRAALGIWGSPRTPPMRTSRCSSRPSRGSSWNRATARAPRPRWSGRRSSPPHLRTGQGGSRARPTWGPWSPVTCTAAHACCSRHNSHRVTLRRSRR